MDDLCGTVVDGRYCVDKMIQSGFFGTTWLARDKEKDTEVCLKTFLRDSTSKKKELDILKKLCIGNFCHDNLCAILDVCTVRAPIVSRKGDMVGATQYVVFEYCSGADLFNFLIVGPYERKRSVSGFPEPLARHYFTQALLAVMYLHERGVFHRDIKPENCVLDHNYNLKLTDFGTNKFLPLTPGPVRATTKKIGTDSYRAPEVDSSKEYDPSAADVWSLGLTLFFMTAIEDMVVRGQMLDPYLKPLLAPLGIFFPFPFQCHLLDSYMKTDAEVAVCMQSFGGPPVSKCLPNIKYWTEWNDLKLRFSHDLVDLFNCMFVLNPSHRGVLRDLAGHPWISKATPLSPVEIVEQMTNRCPRNVAASLHASPSVIARKLLGGVDQAILRQTLSGHDGSGLSSSSEYLSDSEVWEMTDQLQAMEGLQLDMASSEDIQDLMIDISFLRCVLGGLLQQPDAEKARSVLFSDIRSTWVTQMLGVVGFLPQDRLLYLMQDWVDPGLIGHALEMLEGVEFAVSRSVIKVACTDVDEETMEEAMDEVDCQSSLTGKEMEDNIIVSESNDSGTGSYNNMHSAQTDDNQTGIRGRCSSESSSPTAHIQLGSMEAQSSQDSCWTSYTNGNSLSAQSSQEELPEAMLMPRQDCSNSNRLMVLDTTVERHKPLQFKSAGEFCKMSGLLCSYGCYQIAICGQLALYCRGKTASFSARVVSIDSNKGSIGISSWCFQGGEEWLSILSRLGNDMLSHT